MQGKRRESQPQWQPITQLALIDRDIDGMVESASEQYANLLQARPKPYVLDDYTVGRVREVFTTQQNDLWLFDEQLKRWKAGQLSTVQRKEVERLVGQMTKLRQVIDSILNLADELKEGTIEKQLAKSYQQLGLTFLLPHLP